MQQLAFVEGASVASAVTVTGSLTAWLKLSLELLVSLAIAKSHKNHNFKIIIKTRVQNQKSSWKHKNTKSKKNLIRKLKFMQDLGFEQGI